jgi:hypothetical protein
MNVNLSASPEQIGHDAIDRLVAEISKLWKTGLDSRLKLGEYFSKLRDQTAKYERNRDGYSYAASVAKTPVPRGTAENYRHMWDAKQACGISGDLFLVLCEEGVNLGTIRENLGGAFKGAVNEFLDRFETIHAADAKSVKELAKEMKGRLIAKASRIARSCRQARSLLQAERARGAALLISRVENGHTVPTVETLQKMARAG